MNSTLRRILAFTAGVLLLSYIGFQIYNSSYKGVKTETALSITSYDNINTNGYIIRNEQLLSANNEGVKVFTVQNGSRVPKNGIVANVYSTKEAADAIENIAIINAKINTLNEIQNQNKIYASDHDILGKQINERFISILNDVDDGNFLSVETGKTELLNLINENQLTVGKVSNFNSEISELKKESESLTKLTQIPTYIKS